jgi:hypothetical protein
MNTSAPFIRRPVATTLLTIALLLSGAIAYRSQMLTLCTTPVVYLYMDRFRSWVSGGKRLRQLAAAPSASASD